MEITYLRTGYPDRLTGSFLGISRYNRPTFIPDPGNNYELIVAGFFDIGFLAEL